MFIGYNIIYISDDYKIKIHGYLIFQSFMKSKTTHRLTVRISLF